MGTPHSPLVATGQQIGAGWTPALSVVKALAALAIARRLGGEALYWMADEDHDQLEVATSVALEGSRLRRLRIPFSAPERTATGWLPWGEAQQKAAEAAWGDLPAPLEPTLRGHALALGDPLWHLGIRPFSPTRDLDREALQDELQRWRALDLEAQLIRQAARLQAEGAPLPLDPATQAAWFALDPVTGRRTRLEPGQPCAAGTWLSPGAAIRPLLQSLALPVTHVVLGPAERAYWRLTEPLWECVGLQPPTLLPRPSLFLLPSGARITPADLEDLRQGRWEAFADHDGLPTSAPLPRPDPAWGPVVSERFQQDMARTRERLARLDRRVLRERAARRLGMDPEHLRQTLFPLDRPQERILPGLLWLRQPALLARMLDALGSGDPLILLAP